MATWRPARACCARTAFQTSPQHCGTTRESSDALAWRRITARGILSSWSNWTAGDVNGLFLIISDQKKRDPNFLYGSPNSQEFGLRIGSPMFKARSPFTHLITVQTTHHSKIKTP